MEGFNFKNNYVLENETVLLRPLEISDIVNLLSFAINEPDTWKYSIVSAAGENGMKTYIENAIKQRIAGKEYAFIVKDKTTNKYAGCTRFYDIQLEYETIQIGYTWYGKDFRGTGLNKNCKLLLLDFAFAKMKMQRVEFRADNNNEISRAAMISIGCSVEGVLRNHMPNTTGGRRDSTILSILKQEWEESLKEKLISRPSKSRF